MNGITINIDPVIVHLMGLEIRWYSLAVLLAVVTAIVIISREAPKKGISSDEIYSMALWVLTSGIVGARLFHVLDHLPYYVQNPAQILQFQGLAIWGAVAGGLVAVIVYARVKHLSLGRIVDVAAPGLLAAQIIGRFGCIVNGDAYGGPTNLPWGFIYTNPGAMIPDNLAGIPTHPYPIYEIIWNLASLAVIWRLRNYFRVDGMLFLVYLAIYSTGRFLLTFVRQENQLLWGLQEAQLLALLVFAVAAGMFFYLARASSAKLVEEPVEAEAEAE